MSRGPVTVRLSECEPKVRELLASTLAKQLSTRAYAIGLFLWPKAHFPSLGDRSEFQPLHQSHPVPEILIAGPVECLVASPVDAAEKGIEGNILDLRPVPIPEPGPVTPVLEAFGTGV